MTTDQRFPSISVTDLEGRSLVFPGDKVESGDVLADVRTAAGADGRVDTLLET